MLNVISYQYHYYILTDTLNIKMVYQFHNYTLLILFSTLLISGILCFIQMLSIPLEVHGLQNLTYLNIKDTSVQNSNANNNNAKQATPDITNNGNVVGKASDKAVQ